MKKHTVHRMLVMSCLLILVVVTATGCSKAKSGVEYFIYSNHENSNDELREYLFKCLEKEGIEYKLDEERSVWIKKKDNEKAVIRCS